MKLTTKNIRREMEEFETCPMCGSKRTEICVFGNDEGYKVRVFCAECDSQADFAEWLLLLEKKKPEAKAKRKVKKTCRNCGKRKGCSGAMWPFSPCMEWAGRLIVASRQDPVVKEAEEAGGA